MGKQQRQNKRNKQRLRLAHHHPVDGASTTGDHGGGGGPSDRPAIVNINPASAAHRLRHADPKIRHAALVVLHGSVLTAGGGGSGGGGGGGGGGNVVSLRVMQAVREQVMDPDLDCAAVAADCLSQYLLLLSESSASSASTSSPSTDNDKREAATASWAVVLLGRLGQALEALEDAAVVVPGQGGDGGGGGNDNDGQRGDETVTAGAAAPAADISKGGKKDKGKRPKQTHNNSNNNHNDNNSSSNSSSSTIPRATRQLWFALAASCLRALCRLIEQNGQALDQIVHLQKQTFLRVVLGHLEQAMMMALPRPLLSDNNVGGSLPTAPVVDDATTTATTTGAIMMDHDDTTDSNSAAAAAAATRAALSATSSKQQCPYQQDVALYAARCLHSALDENPELGEVAVATAIAAVVSGDGTTTTVSTVWDRLLSSPSSTTMLSPKLALAQLHLIGCLVNLYQQQPNNGAISRLLLRYGLSSTEGRLWTAMFPNNNDDDEVIQNQPQATPALLLAHRLVDLQSRYDEARTLFETQRHDQEMEDDIIRTVQERKEPARDIARRQKALLSSSSQETATKSSTMMDDDDDDWDDDGNKEDNCGGAAKDEEPASKIKRGKFTAEREQDGEQALEEALQAWTDSAIAPVQLALEVTANLLSYWIHDESSSSDDDMDVDWDHNHHPRCVDDEANDVQKSLKQSKLAHNLVDLLETLCHYHNNRRRRQQDRHRCDLNGNSGDGPDPLLSDVEETIGKACACISNCILGDVLLTQTEQPSTLLWQRVWDCLRRSQPSGGDGSKEGGSGTNATTTNAVVTDGISGILVLLAQRQPQMLEGMFGRGATSSSATMNTVLVTLLNMTTSPETQRNAVCLISIAVANLPPSSQSSSDVVVRTVTRDLLSLLSSSSSSTTADPVRAEVLNTFMDWYGQDDFYPHIFTELHVLDGIEECLSRMSSDGSSAGNNGNGRRQEGSRCCPDDDDEDGNILFNARRFVSYKKQTLL